MALLLYQADVRTGAMFNLQRNVADVEPVMQYLLSMCANFIRCAHRHVVHADVRFHVMVVFSY